jgi:predicted transcriptional regulator
VKVAIMQPYFFPYIGYWQLINAVDTFVMYDDVNFIKKGYINRNSILIDNDAHIITLSLMGASQNKLINKIDVGNNKEKILKTIEFAYRKSPQFKNVYPLIVKIMQYDEKNLAKFLGVSIKLISQYLHIDTNIIYSSNIQKDNTLRGQEKILDIVHKLNAKNYINPIGGQQLYDYESFKKENIKLNFLKTKDIEYPQYKNNFVSNLSILDILMFNSIEDIHKMLSEYILI